LFEQQFVVYLRILLAFGIAITISLRHIRIPYYLISKTSPLLTQLQFAQKRIIVLKNLPPARRKAEGRAEGLFSQDSFSITLAGISFLAIVRRYVI